MLIIFIQITIDNKRYSKFIRARKRLHNIAKHTNSPGDCAKYRKTRNICVNKIRNAKQTYYNKIPNILKTGHLTSKQWWATLRKITGTKNMSTYPPLKSDNNSLPISDDKIKADLFN